MMYSIDKLTELPRRQPRIPTRPRQIIGQIPSAQIGQSTRLDRLQEPFRPHHEPPPMLGLHALFIQP
jgi:hypothetical protein